MKLIATLLALALSAPLAASAAGTSKYFRCGGLGNEILRLQLAGPRYGDAISFNLEPEELRQLLLPGEQNLAVTGTPSVSGALQVGACMAQKDGDVLVRCAVDAVRNPADWILLNYTFSRTEDLGRGHQQSVRITRSLGAKVFDLKVKRVGTDAVLDLDMIVDTAAESNKKLHFERKLATLDKDWFYCRIE